MQFHRLVGRVKMDNDLKLIETPVKSIPICPSCIKAWNIIDKLLVGMLISDPRWKPAADWLSKNRQDNIPNFDNKVH